MNLTELEKMYQRAERFRKRLGVKSGAGTAWSHTFEDNETHYYSLKGVKSPEEVKDDLESAFVWLWSLKDHVIKYIAPKGKAGRWVECRVNADPYLCVCADLANSPKHGGLDRPPRSGKTPRLGNLKYNIPQKAVEEISFGACNVDMSVADPSLITLEWPIFDDNGTYIGDALKYLEYGLNAWESIISEAEKAV